MNPIAIPINIPVRDADKININASYMYKRIILVLWSPIALKTPSSFVYSNKLALIDELKEKKHKNIVISMIILKIIFNRFLILL